MTVSAVENSSESKANNSRRRSSYSQSGDESTYLQQNEMTVEIKGTTSDVNYTAMKRKLLHCNKALAWHLTEKDLCGHQLITDDSEDRSNLWITAAKRMQRKLNRTVKNRLYQMSMSSFFDKTFQLRSLFGSYNKPSFFADLVAGISVGIASIPMGMSYSMLAGLPPAHGLYTNIFFPLFYMFLGTSNQVCIGTSALEATMAYEAIGKIVGLDASPQAWLNAAIGLSFTVGVILILMNILHLGIVTSLLADPVLGGFTTGIAVTIASVQLKNVFGIKGPRMDTIHTLNYVIRHITETNLWTFGIFTVGILQLYAFSYINARYIKKFPLPGSLFMLSFFLLLQYVIDYPKYGVSVVGNIPAGLPTPMLFDFDSTIISPMIVQAITYAILYSIIHISIVKSLANKQELEVDANQEFLATGVASLLGSFFQCYPISTSVSRSSIAHTIGAKTILYTIPNISVVILVTTLITPFLYYLPIPALSAVIMFCVGGMFHLHEAVELFKLWNFDSILWLISFFCTVFLGSMEGVVAGALVAVLWILKKIAFPKVVILGRIPGTLIYKNIERFPAAREVPGCKIIRFDASLNFLNSSSFERHVLRLAQIKKTKHYKSRSKSCSLSSPSVIIIDASSVNDLDVTSICMLKRVERQLRNAGKTMLFSNWKGPMRDFLDRNHFYSVVPLERCFLSLHDAVCWSELFYTNTSAISTPTYKQVEQTLDLSPTLSTTQIEIESAGNHYREWRVFNVNINERTSITSSNINSAQTTSDLAQKGQK